MCKAACGSEGKVVSCRMREDRLSSSHQADAAAPVIVPKSIINGMENRLWLSYHQADWVRDYGELIDVPEQPGEELEVQDGARTAKSQLFTTG